MSPLRNRFVLTTGGSETVGGFEENETTDPRPPWSDTGMCEQLIRVEPLYILDIVFGYGVRC